MIGRLFCKDSTVYLYIIYIWYKVPVKKPTNHFFLKVIKLLSKYWIKALNYHLKKTSSLVIISNKIAARTVLCIYWNFESWKTYTLGKNIKIYQLSEDCIKKFYSKIYSFKLNNYLDLIDWWMINLDYFTLFIQLSYYFNAILMLNTWVRFAHSSIQQIL